MTTSNTVETAAGGSSDTELVQAAKAYVDQQLAVMQAFGAAPGLSADAYARLVQEVVAVTHQLRAGGSPAAGTPPAAPVVTATITRCLGCPLIEQDKHEGAYVWVCSRGQKHGPLTDASLDHAPPDWCPLRAESLFVTLGPAVVATGGTR